MPPHARPRPKHLPAKLRAIRNALNGTQGEIAFLVGVTTARVHEYENGKREPNLLTLLAYAQTARIPVDHIINDKITLAEFRNALIGSTLSEFGEQDCP